MCRMTDVCQQMMTKAGRERYALVHQILYTVVAEMVGITAFSDVRETLYSLEVLFMVLVWKTTTLPGVIVAVTFVYQLLTYT